jgi:hypothetical protein
MRRPVAALVIMAVIISVLVILCTPRSTSRSSAISSAGSVPGPRSADTTARAEVRVLVLDFDPVIPDSGRFRAHRVFNWTDPRLPKAVGTNSDGRHNDWWRYVVQFEELVIRNP